MANPQNESQEKKVKKLEKYLRRFKAAVLPIPIGKLKATDKRKSTDSTSNQNTHKSTNIENSAKKNETVITVKDKPIVDMPITKNSGENSETVENIMDNNQNKYSEPTLVPATSFLLLNSHDIIIPLNTDSFTCPQCHTPHSVHFVREDTEQGESKEIYICLSHGNHGCGWEGIQKPDENEIHENITANIGFKPLRLN
ncbi:8688_t:CDS:2 [Acaulospora morrowiae]|uniref:8688_t:CDS:1 n=1 Tax=Acaulospora morrowiae TaxID=94023 RepID=A0A9N8W431_9GLOM|nr:8688_t:CDS:2 [Acaulospora morrowiae]